MKQILAPLELIVIDDGSTDASPKIIEQVLRECPFPCEIITRPNRGLCATLNEGLARTRGQYFAYLGSDDVWLPGFLQARVNLLEARPLAVLGYGHAYYIDEQNRIIDCTQDWADYADGDARQMLLSTIAPMSPTVLYRRSVLERHGWNEKAKIEDYDLYLRLSVEGDFAFDQQVLSAWRQHGYNTSRDQTMMIEEKLRAQRRVAADLGISTEEIANLQRRAKFICAEDLARVGEKAKALELMSHNLSAATSLRSVVRMLLRLCIPYSFMNWRRQRLQRRAHERYCSIQL